MKTTKTMKKKTNKPQGSGAKEVDTFKALLFLSTGESIGAIHPFRLKAAPSFYAGFERTTAGEARNEEIKIPDDIKRDDTVYILRMGPAVLREWMPEWMFEAAFEPVPKTRKDTPDTGQTNIPDTGDPALNDILHRLSEERDAGDKYMAGARERLMHILKEYLGQKYGQKVCFILPTGDPVGDMLDDRSFYPSSVTISDKHGFAACSAAVSMGLTPEGKINIPTCEAGSIHDAEEYLSNDELLILCHTITDYERLLPEIRRELAENGGWEEFARQRLAEHFPTASEEMREDFIHEHWENLRTETCNLKRFEQQVKENNK